MAYEGYLIKVNGNEIDDKRFISAESYQVTKNVQDLDSYRDANGILHRNALSHYAMKVEFETPAMLTNTDIATLMSLMGVANNTERKVSVTCYCPEIDGYVTQDMYVPDINFKMYGTYGGVIHYSKIRIAFIGY